MTTSIPKPRITSFVSTGHNPTTINVPLGSRVVLTKRRSGWVRYIGKLKNEAGEWYGIALDEGKGDSDGSHEKERHFECAANHGVFVRRKEIFCVKEYPIRSKGGPPSPVTHNNSDAGSSTGSSVDSHDAAAPQPQPPPPPSSLSSDVIAAVAPAPSAITTSHASVVQQASVVTTPLVRTFKSFRKELGLQISPTKVANNDNHSGSSSSGSHATSSPKAQSTVSSPASATRSSGLRSPSNSRFTSFSSPSPTASRTASIVSQMVVTPLEKSSHLPTPKPPKQAPIAEPPTCSERDEQQRQQALAQDVSHLQPSVADLLDDCGGISSLSDLYRDTPAEAPVEIITRCAAIVSSRTESTAAPPSHTVAPVAAAPVLSRVSSFSTSTAVESIKSPRTAEPTPAPLFFRRAHIGSPTLGRRVSFPNGGGASSPPSDKMSPTHSATSARMVELEKEINVMKTNHENIVTVLRATNKQHAANVLELRAQVEALTEGNHWLEKQLASKNALIAELREMENSGDRVPRAEVESIIAIKDAQIQTLEREITKLKQQVLRIETEKDSVLCQQARHARWRQEKDEVRIAKLREDVLTMCNERTSLQSELQDLKEMTFLF